MQIREKQYESVLIMNRAVQWIDNLNGELNGSRAESHNALARISED